MYLRKKKKIKSQLCASINAVPNTHRILRVPILYYCTTFDNKSVVYLTRPALGLLHAYPSIVTDRFHAVMGQKSNLYNDASFKCYVIFSS